MLLRPKAQGANAEQKPQTKMIREHIPTYFNELHSYTWVSLFIYQEGGYRTKVELHIDNVRNKWRE